MGRRCASCGAAGRVGASFCAGCGARADGDEAGSTAEHPEGGERRQLTILFCDLAGSTSPQVVGAGTNILLPLEKPRD